MVDEGRGPGGPPAFGWHRAARSRRAVREPGPAQPPPASERRHVSEDLRFSTERPEACPWLYLYADPDARAAFVTAEHRCELRPDEVPGPGHQLAYCLTPNHVSCPQLRSYEAARHAAAQEERARTSPLAPAGAPGFGARAVPEQAAASRIPMRQAPRERTMLSRFAWATAGAVGALALVGMLAFAYAPDRVASEPAEVPTASPTADVTAQATGDDVGLTGTVVVGSEATDEASPTPLATPEPPRTYIVQPGDTLAAIAREFETSVTALVEVNGIADGRLISIGDELLIPGAEPEAATTE